MAKQTQKIERTEAIKLFGKLWNTAVILSLCQQGNITVIEASKILGWKYSETIATLQRWKQDRIDVWRTLSRQKRTVPKFPGE